jgi:hypothetical protein
MKVNTHWFVVAGILLSSNTHAAERAVYVTLIPNLSLRNTGDLHEYRPVALGNGVVAAGFDKDGDQEIYYTDGFTSRKFEITPNGKSEIEYLVPVDRWAYFKARGPHGEDELYRTDGDALELIPRYYSDLAPDPHFNIAFNNRLYFAGNSPGGGRSLFSYDGETMANLSVQGFRISNYAP